jgi:predicted transcriptional regulator
MTTIHSNSSIVEASKLMRECHTTELLVVAEAGGEVVPLGTVTADDIVTRVIALDLDPEVLTAGDVARVAAAA